jgi:hypothetical protein
MRSTRSAVVLLVVAALFGALTVSIAYGFAVDYGDTGAGRWGSAVDGLRWWWFGVAIVAVLALGALRMAFGSLLVRAAAVVLVLGTLVGTGAGAAIGTEHKLARYPAVPDCTDEFTSGPAVPVVRAAQAAYEELDHPGPFSGGGSSGVDGCSSELIVADGTDPRPAYRRTLSGQGWEVSADTGDALRAVRRGQAFELSGPDEGWWVWIGPDGLEEQGLEEGEVGPRT